MAGSVKTQESELLREQLATSSAIRERVPRSGRPPPVNPAGRVRRCVGARLKLFREVSSPLPPGARDPNLELRCSSIVCRTQSLRPFLKVLGSYVQSIAVGARRVERYVTVTPWRARVSAGPHRACALALAANSGARPGGSPRRAWNWPLSRSALAEHGMLHTFGDSGV